MVSSSPTSSRSGVFYFSQGWKLITLPGIRRFVILPLLVNIILMGARLPGYLPALIAGSPRS
jgi:CysZ protein